MIEITGTIAGAKTALELIKTAIEARDDSKAKAAVAEMSMKLLDISQSALAVHTELAAARQALIAAVDELRVVQHRAAERERYTLTEVRAGAYAYARKPARDGQEAGPPYFCQPCYDAAVQAVLVKSHAGTYLECPVAESHAIQLKAIPTRPRLR